MRASLRSEGQMSRSLGTIMQKIVFCSYLRQKWINLRQTKIKMSSRPLCTYLWIHLNSDNVLFCFSDICLLVYLLRTSHTFRSLYFGTW